MDTGFDLLARIPGAVVLHDHYSIAPIISIADLRYLFPKDDSWSSELNWLFLSTSGVHGSYLTLDDLDEQVGWSDARWREEYCLDDDEVIEKDLVITVLVVQPRVCVLRYGRIALTPADIPYLRRVVTRTLAGVAATQVGNTTPAGVGGQQE